MGKGLVNYKAAMETLGWKAGFVERWIPQAKRMIDLFGIADYVVLVPGEVGLTLIQTTSGHGNGMKRVGKILLTGDILKNLLLSKNKVEVWEWNRYSPRGTKGVTVNAKRWEFYLYPPQTTLLTSKNYEVRFREVETYQELKAADRQSLSS